MTGRLLEAAYAGADGLNFMALNGGPSHKLTQAFPLLVNCETQEEEDDLWESFRQRENAPVARPPAVQRVFT